MKKTNKTPIIILIILFLLALATVLFMMFAVHKNGEVLGAPGPKVSFLNNLRYSIRLYRNLDDLQEKVNFDNGSERKFELNNDATATDVCRNLQQDAFVNSAISTCDLMIYKGYDRSLSPGTYTISSGLNAIETLELISKGDNRDLHFTIFAGWRLEEIAQVIDQLGFEFDGDAFLAYAKNPPSEIRSNLQLPADRSLEGYLHPGEYSLKPTITSEEFVDEALGRTQAVIDEAIPLKNEQSQRLTTDQIIILASIIQRETLASEEMPLIASVFYNRLEINMPLQTDPTVQYAIGYNQNGENWWKSPLTYDDLAVDSDYNTYKVFGLTPGAISNPGREAIMAAFRPEQSDYFYFRAKCDGSLTHNFAITYGEHLENGCE
ncbi:MAG: endolytic transglycosylase MltG [Anaerolineaceae bacterium]|nr:endolytic transglycosylase MltG [Anaerolineaceae bacterium]